MAYNPGIPITQANPLPVTNPDGSLIGAGGGGGGGAATIADGADVAEGAKADAAYAGSGAASLIAISKGLYAAMVAPTPAGTAIIGKVGIDQTTPGTTNAVVATGASANGAAVNPSPVTIAGYDGANIRSLSVDTAGKLVVSTNSTITAFSQGNVASGSTDSGAPVKIGGYGNSTTPTAVTNGQRVNAWYGLYGQAVSAPVGASISAATFAASLGSTQNANTNVTLNYAAQMGLSLLSDGTNFYGQGGNASGTYMQGNVASGVTNAGNPLLMGGVGNSSTPTAVTAGQRVNAWYSLNGAAMSVVTANVSTIADGTALSFAGAFAYSNGSAIYPGIVPLVSNGTSLDKSTVPNLVSRIASAAATTNATVAKASSGKVHEIIAYNTTASVKFLKLYNKATAPTVGTDTPVLTLAIPPNGSLVMSWPNGGLYFATGIAYALTGLAADSDTTALTAGDVVGLNISIS